jgi:hypothetical protein
MIDIMLFLVGSAVIASALIIGIGVSIYDIRSMQTKVRSDARPYPTRRRKWPLMSILMTVSDERDNLHHALTSLETNPYPALEIIIVNLTADKRVRKSVRKLISSPHQRPVFLYMNDRHYEQSEALRHAYRRYGSGDFILTLDETDDLTPETLTHIVYYFTHYPTVSAICAKKITALSYQLTGVWQRYIDVSTNLLQKTRSSLTNTAFNMRLPIAYRKKFFTSPLADKAFSPLPYVDTIVVHSSPPRTTFEAVVQAYHHEQQLMYAAALQIGRTRRSVRSWLATFGILYLWLAGISLPLLLTYLLYLATYLHQPMLLFLAASCFTAVLLYGIWWDDSMNLNHKIFYSSLIPVTYGMFYIHSFVWLLASVMSVVMIIDTWRTRKLQTAQNRFTI